MTNNSQDPASQQPQVTAPQAAGDTLPHPPNDAAADTTRQRIQRLPPEVGAVLITVGVVGLILPGPVGTPLLLAGGLALMPGVFGKLEHWVERKFPKLHWHGMRNVERFIDDLEKRFPPQPPATGP